MKTPLFAAAPLAALALVASAWAAEPPRPTDPAAAPPRGANVDVDVNRNADTSSGTQVRAAKSFRASQLSGMNVRNMQNENVGTIDDVVIDLSTGQAKYAALSFGGVLGFGNKLFAVPFSQMKFHHGQEEQYFVVNVTKEQLDTAPGFDKDKWPDFANAKWWADVDTYYRKPATGTNSTPNTVPPSTVPRTN